MSFSANIKDLRKKYNLSQKELGKIAGVTDKAVWRWEQGGMPLMGAVENIAQHFGMRKSELLDDENLLSTPWDENIYTTKDKHYNGLDKIKIEIANITKQILNTNDNETELKRIKDIIQTFLE